MTVIDKTYSTSAVAKLIGIHPNTVRLYEEWGMITPPVRRENGYRVFTELHIYQFRIARIALQTEVIQNGLRKKAISIIKATANCDFDSALNLTDEYICRIDSEITHAAEAVGIVKAMCSDKADTTVRLKRKEASALLDLSMDTLRNWEMNGLIKIKRRENGYRVYTDDDIRRFKIIRTLKCADYSLSAILRMLSVLDANRAADIDSALNEPGEGEAIISACDRLAVSLHNAKVNAGVIRALLAEIKVKYSNPPL